MESLDFDQVLNICLDRMHAGDNSEDCLASFPTYAERLDPLLCVAVLLQTPGGLAMSSEGFDAGRSRLLSRALHNQRKHQPASVRRESLSGLLGGVRRLALFGIAGVLLLSVLLSAGTVSAASASLPGSPLYAVKRATESLVSSVAFTPQLQARIHLAWADRRLREIEAVVARDGLADESLLEALGQETERSLSAAEQAGVGSLRAALVHTEQQQAVLSRVLDKAPLAARPALEHALEVSARGHARARFALEQVDKPGPPVTPPGDVGNKKPPHKNQEDPTVADPPGTPSGPSESEDGLHLPGKGQGSNQSGSRDKVEDQDHGRGQSQDQDQDKIKDPKPEQGQGQDRDHGPEDKTGPPGQDKEPGNGPPPAQDNTKQDKPDNPGNPKGKSK
jgi:hypothetical protein